MGPLAVPEAFSQNWTVKTFSEYQDVTNFLHSVDICTERAKGVVAKMVAGTLGWIRQYMLAVVFFLAMHLYVSILKKKKSS